jgi:hypothetical protein
MAKKVLGQVSPSATTMTALYTVPSLKETVVSTISICNQTTSSKSYRIAVRPAGATLAAQHYLAYDAPIAANDTVALTLGITLAATDVLAVYTSATTVSFQAFGDES